MKIDRNMPLLAMCSLLGCSGPRIDTYEIELTTDTEPQMVELFYNPDPHSMKYASAYGLKFPQSYYAYRDNHNYREQTTIGLLLDRRSLRALTEVMRSETGIHESLSVPRWKEGALKKLQLARYRDRELFVRIIGNTGGGVWKPREGTPVLGQVAGFAIMQNKAAGTGDLMPRLEGYSPSQPSLHMVCYARVPNCTFFVDYRKSQITFVLPRSQVAEAHASARGIIQLLDRHFVYVSPYS
jgi:hypothetical protein